ncbi:Uncharacterised protein [Delftia tsuruhatensis]|uniref:hypothetical protein n=1 Tax=Delftia tsuruhatensis TaxID=180282 RepID=UPI001E756959|nr:hypothetical protein [Delftia tsuruhatensis]CAB5719345.1 Uncharacterised protein [Delftia tsuruhatensis]CAC9687859.1 Uncharacterised protein [Delftia tsuruhatensis]
MSLDAVISADLVKTRAEIAALSSAVAVARNEISGLNTQLTSNSHIKSIQRGVIDMGSVLTRTVSITAVTPGKSSLKNLGNTGAFYSSVFTSQGNNSVFSSNSVMLELVNGNQIKATGIVATPYYNTLVSWELVEYK